MVMHGFEADAVALTLESLQRPVLGALGVAAVVVVVAEVLVRRVPCQHVVDRDEHGVGDCNHGLLVPAMAHDATVAGRQRPPSMPDGTEGRFGECGTEPRVPPPGLSGAMLPGTLVVAGTERSPAGEVPGAREDAHVDADHSDHYLRGPLFHTGDRTDPVRCQSLSVAPCRERP